MTIRLGGLRFKISLEKYDGYSASDISLELNIRVERDINYLKHVDWVLNAWIPGREEDQEIPF